MIFANGMTRNVIIIGNYAFKFPTFKSHSLFLNGCYSNNREREFCKRWEGFISDSDEFNLYLLVAPSIWCSWFGLIQIQKRVEILKRDLTEKELESLSRITTERKHINFGIYKGRLVCVDYPY